MTEAEAIKLIDERMCFGRGKWSKHHMPEIDDYWKAGQMAIKALKQPMRKKGKWRWSEDMMCFICSECESGWKEQPTLMGKPLYEWCPVCGADMRGGQDE